MKKFDYDLDYKSLDLRKTPEIYRVGVGEQGVLTVEPYKTEILPHWKFKDPKTARVSSQSLLKMFKCYKQSQDFVGMDMARKFLQMGYTRSRRYANHKSGRKYSEAGDPLPDTVDSVKAESAEIFKTAWMKVEADPDYTDMKLHWKLAFG